MGKLETFDGRQTTWEGLWWHPEYNGYSSGAIDLSELRKFKGKVRLYVRKNKFYENGSNRPNYCFCLKDSNSPTFTEIGVDFDTTEVDGHPYKEDGCYYTEDGDRLYTESEVIDCIHGAATDGARGYDGFDLLIGDYV